MFGRQQEMYDPTKAAKKKKQHVYYALFSASSHCWESHKDIFIFMMQETNTKLLCLEQAPTRFTRTSGPLATEASAFPSSSSHALLLSPISSAATMQKKTKIFFFRVTMAAYYMAFRYF
jgi:hypothetical protein